jgi:hypothetical protein
VDDIVPLHCVESNRSAPFFHDLHESLVKKGFVYRRGCPYRVVVLKSYAVCTAPAPGASRGFIRLELFKEEQPLYQVQQEFWDESDRDVIDTLVSHMAEVVIPALP